MRGGCGVTLALALLAWLAIIFAATRLLGTALENTFNTVAVRLNGASK